MKATTDLCDQWDATWVIPGEILLMADPALGMQKIASYIASHVKLILPNLPLNLEELSFRAETLENTRFLSYFFQFGESF